MHVGMLYVSLGSNVIVTIAEFARRENVCILVLSVSS
jgi:hypothetical protein